MAWFLIYVVTLCYGPAITLHASTMIARQESDKKIVLGYIISSVLASLMIIGSLLDKFGWQPALGGVVQHTASIAGLVFFAVVLIGIIWDQYPQLFGTGTNDDDIFFGILLFSFFMIAGLLQLSFGPVAMQAAVAACSFLFFMVGVAACMNGRFLGVHLLPIEGFFLVLIWAAAVLLFHASDPIEFWISLCAVALIGVFGKFSLRTVAREREKGQRMALLNEEFRQVNEARNDFAAMVAHQLRSPIGGIRAASSLLVDGTYGPLPPKALEASVLIKNAADRLLSLAETYLQGIRLHQRIFASNPIETNPVQQIESIVKELMPLAELKGVELKVEGKDVPPVMVVEREALTNAVFNLADNAIKYTDKGSVTINIKWAKGNLVVAVADTGIGMNQEELASAFEKFSRSSIAKGRQRAGTGLGLYIIKRLLTTAGGSITAKSQGMGRGSVFEFTLPAKTVDDPTLSR